MKKLLPLILIAAFCSQGCLLLMAKHMAHSGGSSDDGSSSSIEVNEIGISSGPAIDATGDPKQETRNVQDFHGISAGAIFEVVYKTGAPSLKITAQPNIMSHVVSKVTDGVLHLGLDHNINNLRVLKVEVSSSNLDSVEASGAASVSIDGVKGEDFKLASSGTSRVTGEARISKLNLEVSGSGNVGLKGIQHASLDGSISGSGRVKLQGTAADTNLEVSGSGDLQADGLTAENVTLSLSGAASVTLSGKTNELKVEAEGGAKANLSNLVAQTCNAQASGAGNIQVDVRNTLDAEASGGARVNYRGNPGTVHRDTSGAGSIDPS